MKYMANIEKSAFKPGEYVGYSSGQVFRIKRQARSHWVAWNPDRSIHYNGARLQDISTRLHCLARQGA